MRAPTISATIQRRILVNYRVDPDALAAILPEPFRPALVGDFAVAGICLIRLGGIRPAGLPPAMGLTTENAAHRVAVEWDTADGPVTGVFIPRRDTSSRLGSLLGGRVFPGWQHRARFQVEEAEGVYRVQVSSHDGEVQILVAAHRTATVKAGSVFGSVEQASEFFRCAPVGYAATPTAGVFDGVALTAQGWAIEPLHLDEVRSSFFDSRDRFAAGTAVPDSAFLMGGLETSWRPLPALSALRQGSHAPNRAGQPALP
ncbi:MAG: acetoacetate decarboxylase family protein [Actinomycetota bacterium]|nr:acetoacetate decarboxylase family protein [Actinomycetota bacterium]MDQ6946983.1 acetoacetate decarboxylase family protein [Actinomycetota bacterium]